jgi:hypothetical protein
MLLPPPSSPVGGSTHSITTAGVGGDPSEDGGGFGLIAVDTIDDADGDDDDVTAVDGGGLETEVGTTGDVGGGGGGLLGHPVTPAKQLWVTSEHSRRDPPGHGSQTDLALEEDAPQKNRSGLAFPSTTPGNIIVPSYSGHLTPKLSPNLSTTLCQFVQTALSSSNN